MHAAKLSELRPYGGAGASLNKPYIYRQRRRSAFAIHAVNTNTVETHGQLSEVPILNGPEYFPNLSFEGSEILAEFVF